MLSCKSHRSVYDLEKMLNFSIELGALKLLSTSNESSDIQKAEQYGSVKGYFKKPLFGSDLIAEFDKIPALAA